MGRGGDRQYFIAGAAAQRKKERKGGSWPGAATLWKRRRGLARSAGGGDRQRPATGRAWVGGMAVRGSRGGGGSQVHGLR
jgi:hypothetical protein